METSTINNNADVVFKASGTNGMYGNTVFNPLTHKLGNRFTYVAAVGHVKTYSILEKLDSFVRGC